MHHTIDDSETRPNAERKQYPHKQTHVIGESRPDFAYNQMDYIRAEHPAVTANMQTSDSEYRYDQQSSTIVHYANLKA